MLAVRNPGAANSNHGVSVRDWLFVFPLCGFSLSLFCNSNLRTLVLGRFSHAVGIPAHSFVTLEPQHGQQF